MAKIYFTKNVKPYLCVAVVVLVIVADPDDLAVVGGGGGPLHLGREEVGEALAGEAVDVVDRVPLARQRVHEHASSRRDCSLGDLKSWVG